MTQLKDSMTNIEKIRQEIERRKTHFNKEATKYQYRNIDYANNCFGARDALRDLLAFIDSMPDETCKDSLQVPETCKENTDSFTSLEEAAVRWEPKYGLQVSELIIRDIRDAFIAGGELQKGQMMKEAVEGEIGYWNQTGLSIRLDKSLEKLGYDMDTKVKIIIIKDND